MKQYNLEAPEDFRELEILAYNGAVPLERPPGAAYFSLTVDKTS